jgi:NAD(P)-dependent dehydrogenase (short-subunit alcohol dehydrogenase family)
MGSNQRLRSGANVNRLRDKVTLVTGSSRGIGAAIAARFAQEGAKVALHGRDAAALLDVRAEIQWAGGCTCQVTADLTQYCEIEDMRRHVERELGPIDILVANAGGNAAKPVPIEDTSEEVARRAGRQSHGDISDRQKHSARHEGAEGRKHHHHLVGGRPPAASGVARRLRRS